MNKYISDIKNAKPQSTLPDDSDHELQKGLLDRRLLIYKNINMTSRTTEHLSVSVGEMGLREVPDFDPYCRATICAIEAEASKALCPLVSTACNGCVIKSRMMGDYHVRFCEQLRGEIPLG